MDIVITSLVALSTGFVGLLAIWLARSKEPAGGFLCGQCGYILKSPTSEKCPECGTPVSDAKPAQKLSSHGRSRLGAWLIGVVFLVISAFFAVVALLLIWLKVILGLRF